ncbi:GspE/PulE family protein [Pseudomonas sp. CMR5c]|uniref:GspE/PulE family protein n=1 Tax=Pseudomonas sp. CMR5c TaxID=658630 RepID=UPI00069E46BB|nr:GspE/PulE family protein [Pseudomonas sp. CMR5c]AZC21436.1 Type II secretory pathway, ATPase PulE/Tfp pilus assembly pathway, ATPase PilB [Pseudomonas sp. CMR5c]
MGANHLPRDRKLELGKLLRDLQAQGRISQEAAGQVMAARQHDIGEPRHPLENIAEQQLPDLHQPGRQLDLDSLTAWLAQEAGQPYLRLDPLQIDAAAITPLMSRAFAQRHGILAIAVDTLSVTVASAQPYVSAWEADLAHALKRSVRRVLASPAQIRHLTLEFYRLARSVSGASNEHRGRGPGNFEQLLKPGNSGQAPDADDAHIVNIVDWLLQYAFAQRASDIHIEPRREQGNLRLRIDGLLHEVYAFEPHVTQAIVSRLKSLGRMNVAERRKPQDGRIKTLTPEGNAVELRLSTLPTAFGEKLVMRIFDPQVLLRDFDQLGFAAEDLACWQAMTAQAHGIILVTGPTGSGKTSTLYATLKKLATPQVNLCTIEDPIEMIEPSFNQMQVQHNIDLGFSSGVRALLRQDPDIIMIGEIRDLETAEMAIQAALTGHLVLSTLHTNDAPGAISRLLELGVPHYLIKATLLGVMAQRLVRTLCRHCKQPVVLDADQWRSLAPAERLPASLHAHRAIGCAECRGTGYRGRVGIYEIMRLNDVLRPLIQPDLDLAGLRRLAAADGMRSLRLAAAQKVTQGLTSLEEALRVTPCNES